MYNGIGLQTARGSGTNGYVQTNKFFVRPRAAITPTAVKDARDEGTLGGIKKPNKDILDHERKRKIELRLVILEETLVDQGYTASEIADKLAEARKSYEAEVSPSSATPDTPDGKRFSDTQTHQIALRKEKQMEIFRSALKLQHDQPPAEPSVQRADKPGSKDSDYEEGEYERGPKSSRKEVARDDVIIANKDKEDYARKQTLALDSEKDKVKTKGAEADSKKEDVKKLLDSRKKKDTRDRELSDSASDISRERRRKLKMGKRKNSDDSSEVSGIRAHKKSSRKYTFTSSNSSSDSSSDSETDVRRSKQSLKQRKRPRVDSSSDSENSSRRRATSRMQRRTQKAESDSDSERLKRVGKTSLGMQGKKRNQMVDSDSDSGGGDAARVKRRVLVDHREHKKRPRNHPDLEAERSMKQSEWRGDRKSNLNYDYEHVPKRDSIQQSRKKREDFESNHDDKIKSSRHALSGMDRKDEKSRNSRRHGSDRSESSDSSDSRLRSKRARNERRGGGLQDSKDSLSDSDWDDRRSEELDRSVNERRKPSSPRVGRKVATCTTRHASDYSTDSDRSSKSISEFDSLSDSEEGRCREKTRLGSVIEKQRPAKLPEDRTAARYEKKEDRERSENREDDNEVRRIESSERYKPIRDPEADAAYYGRGDGNASQPAVRRRGTDDRDGERMLRRKAVRDDDGDDSNRSGRRLDRGEVGRLYDSQTRDVQRRRNDDSGDESRYRSRNTRRDDDSGDENRYRSRNSRGDERHEYERSRPRDERREYQRSRDER